MDPLDVRITKRQLRRHVRYILTAHQIWRLKSREGPGSRPFGLAPASGPPISTMAGDTPKLAPVIVYFDTREGKEKLIMPNGKHSCYYR